MDVLIAVATTAAFVYGVVSLLEPTALPPALYFDASALIITLILAGNYLERRTRARAGSALRSLRELVPPTAHLLSSGGEREVPVEELRPGDIVRVRAGERVPVDGIVRSGRSTVDEATITGEPVPRAKLPADPVLAGTINGEGVLEIETTHLGEATLLGQIGEMLREAEMDRVPLRKRADQLASVFVPSVLGFAVLATLGWWLFGGAPVAVAVLVFVSVTITACPCAFGLATPAALLVGAGRAAESGVLFRGADTLERAARVDLVMADKTGTLTTGRPVLSGIVVTAGETEGLLLAVAAGLESGSTHPLASAVRNAAELRGLRPAAVDDVQAVPGVGVHGRSGTSRYDIERWPDVPDEATVGAFGPALRRAESEGSSLSVLRRDGRPVALLIFDDPVAEGAAEAVRTLAAAGIAVEILSGDREAAVRRVATSVGASAHRSGVRPEAKLRLVEARQREGRTVAFVGDGVNDAPALAIADVGIALGTGADVARQVGRVLLLRPDLRGVPFALFAARRTVAKVRQNLFWAIGYNLALLPLAAGILVPWLGFGIFGILPITGAVAMGLSSTLVLANSLSLRRVLRPWGVAGGPSRPVRPRRQPGPHPAE
jgi:Cu+-exporting ATPase